MFSLPVDRAQPISNVNKHMTEHFKESYKKIKKIKWWLTF